MIDPNLELKLVNSFSSLLEFYEWVNAKTRPIMGIDTETTGLRIYQKDDQLKYGGEPRFRCRMIQVGDDTAGWSFCCDPENDWSGPAIEFMRAYKGQWVAHNISYDAKVLKVCYDFDFPWERTHDTMIMCRILYPHSSAALKVATKVHVDPMAAEAQSTLANGMKANGWEWYDVPYAFEPYWFYGALDPVLAVYLYKALRADLREPEAYDLEMSYLRIAIGMEHRGMKVDLEYSERQYNTLIEGVETHKHWGKDNLGINIFSTVELAKWFDKNGAVLTKKTASGAYAMDKDVLRSIAKTGNSSCKPIAEWVEKVKYNQKLANSYFKNFVNFSIDGIVHPSIQTCEAKTGRTSIKDPALQTLSKSDKTVRRAFLPNEGEVLVSCDLDQVEFRTLGILSKDKNLIKMFNDVDATGGDPFTIIGRDVFDDPNFNKSDPRRTLIKGVVYGKSYGAGVSKMAETAGVPVEHMKEVSDMLENHYHGFKDYPKEVEAKIKRTADPDTGMGYINTLYTGKKIPVDIETAYRGTNYQIQGSCAELLKLNVIEMSNQGIEELLKLPIHDEVIASCSPEDVNEVAHILENCMTVDKFPITLKGGYEYKGTSWAGDIDKLGL